MSKEVQQFYAMIADAMKNKAEPVYVRLYCHACHKFTAHQETRYGSVCTFCGHVQDEEKAR